jgi:hypothetical protein
MVGPNIGTSAALVAALTPGPAWLLAPELERFHED